MYLQNYKLNLQGAFKMLHDSVCKMQRNQIFILDDFSF